ncbi:alpha/beta hydrolase family protein [Rhynchospora pubera]|uniref:Alpha/beta hydrolase family protein n=1 Tax=Rhynchospora pubera TaxID=906938 RepID=A0AAV8HW60_9POAL|nr:alpha/beta hydrolase family protein [Rhynchospora pubera]
MLLHADARAALAATAIASATFQRRRRARPYNLLLFPVASSRLDPSLSSSSSFSSWSPQQQAIASFVKEEKPTICTADELHYAPVPGTDWRLALWRYTPPPEAPKRNHPLMLLSGVGTNAIGFDLSPAASFARHMSSQGFDTWVVEVRGAGLSVRNEPQPKVNESVSTPSTNPIAINGKSNGAMSVVAPAWDEMELVTKLTDAFTRVAETLTSYVNKGQLQGLYEKFFDQVAKLLEDTPLTKKMNDIAERISGLVEAGQGSAVTEQVVFKGELLSYTIEVRDLSQRMVKVLEEGQKTVSPPLFDLQEKFSATLEDFHRQLDLILTYDWDFDHYLEEDIPAAMSYINLHSGRKDGKILAIGHSMGGILLYAMVAKCCYENVEPRLAAIVTIASSVDYTTSNSSLKLLLPLADPAQALNVPAVPLGALLSAAYRPYHSSGPPYLLSWLNEQISCQDMMHPELFSKLVLNNFCTVPAKVLLQLTTAFRDGGLRNRNGDFYFKEHLPNCNVPVLALAGDRDLICPPEAVYETVKLLPQNMVTYKVFGKPEGPHYSHYDLVGGRLAVNEVYPCIVEFLTCHDGVSS